VIGSSAVSDALTETEIGVWTGLAGLAEKGEHLGLRFRRADPAGRDALVGAIVAAYQTALDQRDWTLDEAWTPGTKLATWICPQPKGTGLCRKVVARLWMHRSEEEGQHYRLLVARRKRKVAWLSVEALGIDMTRAELAACGLVFPREASMQTAPADSDNNRVFYIVTPRRFGEDLVLRYEEDEHDQREDHIWDAADDNPDPESYESPEHVRQLHGVGWCPRGHGPYVFKGDEVNKAISAGSHSRHAQRADQSSV